MAQRFSQEKAWAGKCTTNLLGFPAKKLSRSHVQVGRVPKWKMGWFKCCVIWWTEGLSSFLSWQQKDTSRFAKHVGYRIELCWRCVWCICVLLDWSEEQTWLQGEQQLQLNAVQQLCWLFLGAILAFIKYQTLDIEFLAIWLALFPRALYPHVQYKSYILQFVQIWKLTILSWQIFPQNSWKLES